MVNIFFSYSHKDEDLRNELETHLSTLKRQGIINVWHDRRITAGEELGGRISDKLESADIILLLVSPYFLDSDYCYDIEMKRAMERHEASEARVIPVILQTCDWHGAPFGKLMAVPADGKPVSKYPNMHDAFFEITTAIKNVISPLGHANTATLPPTSSTIESTVPPTPRSSNLRIKKNFTDRDKDHFLEESYDYISKFFEGSLVEIARRNPGIEGVFRKIDANHFTSVIYMGGRASSKCRISCGGRSSLMSGITYSMSDSPDENSYNEQLSVEDDGYTLHLKPLGMTTQSKEQLTIEGAAEFYWDLFIKPLQY